MVRMSATETAKEEKKVGLTVIEECGVIGTRKNGKETLRLDYGTWGNNPAKYEIRIWGEKGAGKGIGLTGEELIALGELIKALQEEEAPAPKAKKENKKTSKKQTV